MPAKKAKEEPPIVEGATPAAGSNARFPAVPTEKTAVKASAPNHDAPDWRGICAICLDLLSIVANRQTFYPCCCKRICTECSAKCQQHDERCPLCRAPASTSNAEVVRRLQKHVDKGNAEAQYALGDSYFSGGYGLKQSSKRAFHFYELAAAQGDARAQSKLGFCYEMGEGVKINYTTAEQWYRRAAEQGHPPAQYNLGTMFRNGKGVAQSYDEAVKWWRLAAAQGDVVVAVYGLGVCHAYGQGVPQDDHEALRFFKRAAAQGHAGAAMDVEELEARLAAARPGPTT
jgi:TPR repeat protein